MDISIEHVSASKVVANLKSYDSARYTKLGRNLLQIEQLEKDIKALKAETKEEARQLVAGLFAAEDIVKTRVVETVSFTFELTKNPAPTETFKYAKILEELQDHLTPELITVLEALKSKHRSEVTKSPALKARDKAVTEGVGDSLKGFFNKLLNWVKGWAVRYDSQLDALKAQVA